MARRDKMREAEERGYVAERERASADVIMSSAYRRMGRYVPGDISTMPVRTDNKYDPRKR